MWASLKGLILCVLIQYSEAVCGTSNHTGKHFVFAVPRNGFLNNVEPKIILYFINPGPVDSDVTLDIPAASFSGLPATVVAPAYGRKTLKLAQSYFSQSGSGVDNRGVKVTATEDILVQVSSNGYLSSDGFFVMPSSTLGLEYMTVSYKESALSSYQGPYQIWIAATQSSTTVTVRFNCNTPSTRIARISNVDYYCGDSVVKTLSQYATFQIQSSDIDISGFKVESDKPVAVMCGAYWGSIGTAGYPDHQVDMVPPIDVLGTKYLIPPVKVGDGYVIKVIATQENTQFTITMNDGSSETVNLAAAYAGWTSQKSIASYGEISSTKPVLAAQFTMYDSTDQLNDPSLAILRPLCSYGGSVIVSTPQYYVYTSNSYPYMPNTDITIMISKTQIQNFRFYSMVSSGFTDECSSYVPMISSHLDYAVIQLTPTAGNYLIHARQNTNIYVYTRGYKWAESQVSTGGYLGTDMSAVESRPFYCGVQQTTASTTITTTDSVTTSDIPTSPTELHTSSIGLTTQVFVPESTTESSTLTTNIPTSTTDFPASTSALPASTTDLPATTTNLPATTTDFLASTYHLHASTTDMPVVSTDSLVSTTNFPVWTTDLPATTSEMPLSTTDLPATTTEMPLSTTDLPATITEIPVSTTNLPATTTEIPLSTTDLPATTTNLSESTTDLPATTTIISESSTDLPASTIVQNVSSSTTEHIKKSFKLQSYTLTNMDSFHQPVEAPYAVEIGTSSFSLFILFIVIVVVLDSNHIKNHLVLLKNNLRGCFRQKVTGRQRENENQNRSSFSDTAQLCPMEQEDFV